ncbi:uncharacterized protein LOC130629291 [Hydractinia symbiolongicarpus]|uniref:uncharacterized protein LOC130629291 n=1 Tax=Hydractinia symbiolongicarpus TaxID=13093 RepID=UPI0025504433|nr:uncharacterized protein LOC130629291 [Hydractinia symbiolongicarpus]
MSKLKEKQFTITLTLLSILILQRCHAYMHPNILWDPRNPIFNTTKCGDNARKFSAYIDDSVTVLCGNSEILNTFTDKQINPANFHYNMFVTTDIETYNNRNGQKAKKIHTCQVKQAVMKNMAYTTLDTFLLLSKFKGDINEWTNMIEKTYYFFTTSDGTKKSLSNKEGVNATKDMRFELYICNATSKICPNRERVNVCPGELPLSYTQRSSDDHINNDSVLSKQPAYIVFLVASVALMVGFMLGIAFTVFRKKYKKGKRRQVENGSYQRQESKVSSSTASSSPPTSLTSVEDKTLLSQGPGHQV